ncbi:MAG: hypothetical protein DHS20C05_23780 [Hyphococcus sp.]|nr:MAG: hypothetical protein DHS20C05_23780 [Marinicaulis sp.]
MTAAKKQAKSKAGNGVTAPGVRTATRRARVESKEDAIVKAAYQMFIDVGFAKTTMSEIAKKAGVAEGTLYLYFSNKDALAHTVLADFYERLTLGAKKGVAKLGNTEERLVFLARHHLKNIIKERRILELLSMTDRDSEIYRGSELYKMNRAYVSVFDDVVREGMWRGEIKKTDELWLLRDTFFGALEYGMRTIMLKRRGAEQRVNQLAQTLAEMLIQNTKPAGATENQTSLQNLEKTARRFEKAATRLERITGQM